MNLFLLVLDDKLELLSSYLSKYNDLNFWRYNLTICNKYGVFKKLPELNCSKLYDKWGDSTWNTGLELFSAHFVNLNLRFSYILPY